ncbi:DUF2937 family protein [Roseospira marina]|uniref:DUF2937 family protein n=1 Tax=Roseospira marina TaxID=140057 RepID=A0A5M6I486_9PROT|nr:DUF2937 family protein [Roseospira marina]KAA5602625.1 DUF2937 family protein [Roseospira marina]MBB4316264.1 hypothetical protein [Roseospira marina]MBB5089455.1 hypothetical protein [Roseospira marina]
MPAGWMVRKLDSLAGAVVGAAGGAAASQWREFLQQYLQRLGGHLDEARRNLEHLTGLHALADAAEKPVVAGMMADGRERVGALVEAMRALTEADPLTQPIMFLRTLDPAIAQATLDRFQPALPLDTASLMWAGGGLILALVAYEGIKGAAWVPVAVGRRSLRRRRVRESGRRRARESGRPVSAGRLEPRL